MRLCAVIILLLSTMAAPSLAQVAPVGSPTRCAAVANLLATAEQQALNLRTNMLRFVEAAADLPAEDIAQARAEIDATEQRLGQAAGVAFSYAHVAAPNEETLNYLRTEVSIDALWKELAACEASSVATPAVAPVAPTTPAVAVAPAVQAAPAERGFTRLNGQDPAGSDLGSVAVAPRDYVACRALCAADDRCRAFNLHTPPPHTQGQCWLKFAVGPTRPDPDSISGTRLQATVVPTATFDRTDGQDRAGNDLGMIEVPARDYARCSNLCAAHDRCQAFNLLTPAPHNQSYCWLKHAAGPMRADPNSVSGVRRGAVESP